MNQFTACTFLVIGASVMACGNKEQDTSSVEENVENTDTATQDTDTDTDDSDTGIDSGTEEDSGSDTDSSSNISGSLLIEMDYIDPSLEQAGYTDCTASYVYTESDEALEMETCPDCTHHWRVDIEYSSDCYNWEGPTENPIEIALNLEQEIFYMYYESFGWDAPYTALNCNSGVTVSSTENSFNLVCEVLNGTTSSRTTTLSLNF